MISAPRRGSPTRSMERIFSSVLEKGSSRPRPVVLKPGQQQFTVTPVPASCRANSCENMISISFERPYNFDDCRWLNLPVKVRSSAGVMPPELRDDSEATVTIREGAEEMSLRRNVLLRIQGAR